MRVLSQPYAEKCHDSFQNRAETKPANTRNTRKATETAWIVLRCKSSDTMSLARILSDPDGFYGDLGAWTPVWKRQKRYPRSNKRRLIVLPALPSFVFVPEEHLATLPTVGGHSYRVMYLNDALVRIPDADLNPLRKIDAQPQDKPIKLPGTGSVVKLQGPAFGGLSGKVLHASKRYVTVEVDGFPQPLKIPPSLLQET